MALDSKTKTYRILIIEDDPIDEENIRRVLDVADEEFSSVTRQALQAGVDLLREEDFDAVLLDLSLPDSYGISTVQRMLEEFPNLPIIVLSGTNDKALALEALEQGVKDYLMKESALGETICRSIVNAIEGIASEENC